MWRSGCVVADPTLDRQTADAADSASSTLGPTLNTPTAGYLHVYYEIILSAAFVWVFVLSALRRQRSDRLTVVADPVPSFQNRQMRNLGGTVDDPRARARACTAHGAVYNSVGPTAGIIIHRLRTRRDAPWE